MLEIQYKGRVLQVMTGYYTKPKNPAIWLEDAEGPFCKASHNPTFELPEGLIAIKTWGENEGILEVLIENQIVDEPTNWLRTGFVEAALCPLLIDIEG